jgi:hypothetical protein
MDHVRPGGASPAVTPSLTADVVPGESAGGLVSSRTTYLALAAFAILLGATLRLLGYFDSTLQLWLDEAFWAIHLADGDYEWIRPIGYMELTRALIGIVNNEPMLRSLSLVAGLLHVPLALVALQLSTRSRWIALFGAYVVAIHPTAVAMSKEFKPYALDLSVHLFLLCLALAYLRTERRAWLLGLVATAVVAPLFAWSVVFAYPPIFAVVGFRALRERRLADVAITAGGALLTMAVLAVIFLGRVAGEDAESEYWGNKYGVFYVGGSRAERAVWVTGKTADLAALPAQLDLAVPTRQLESSAQAVLGFAAIAVGMLGAAALLARRRWALAALWLAPWVVAIAFNVAGKWPWGVFRTNIFMLAYATGLLCHGLAAISDRVSTLGRRPLQAGAVAFAVVALLVFPFDLDNFAVKPSSTMAVHSSVRTAMERIGEIEGDAAPGAPRAIAFDAHACPIFIYYANYHTESRKTFSTFFGPERYTFSCARATLPEQWEVFLREHEAFPWVISAKPALVPVTRSEGRRACEAAGGQVDVYEELPAGTVLMRCSRQG